MKFASSRSRRDAVEISLIPLIDLFLNILVFFLVSTSFSQESAFFIQLPQTNSKEQGVSKDSKSIFISLDTQGEISINNEKTTLADLQSTLEKVSQEYRKSAPVVVRADKSVVHGQVVEVLDRVRQAGFENVGMATQSMSSP